MGQGKKVKEDQRINECGVSVDTLYQIYMDDIRHTKNQQWIVTFYVFASQWATVSFLRSIKPRINSYWEFTILFVITFVGILFIRKYQSDIFFYRNRKDSIQADYFDDELKDMMNKQKDTRYFENIGFFLALLCLLSQILTYLVLLCT